MALEAHTTKLRDHIRRRIRTEVFDSYLAELRVVELSAERTVVGVGATLAREATRRCGPQVATACRQLFGSRRVLLAGDGQWFDLDAGKACAASWEPRKPASPERRSSASTRMRQRSGPCGQRGMRDRLDAQRSFRVPFAVAASLPRVASQAFGRHSADQPLDYVGRWGKAYSEETLTAFHHRLLLGALRLAQAGCLTDQGVACSINSLLLAAEGRGSRELPVARDQALPALIGLMHANASFTAHHVAEHSGEPYIAEQRRLERPIVDDVLVRRADDPERLVSLSEIMRRCEHGRYEQTAELARGGGASVLIVFADWVLDALNAPADQAGRTFVLLDVGTFLAVGSRRLFTWLAVQTAPVTDAGAKLPEHVPRPPQNTVHKRIDLNHVSVRDFGRHGQDLDRICEDLREDLCGEHGIAEIDRRIHSAHAVWSGGVLQLWICCRTARELPHRGGPPRRLAARARWLRRGQTPSPSSRQRCREAAHANMPRAARVPGAGRGVPKIVRLARSQTASGDDGDGDG
jgi:hypothetical protein